MTILDKIVTNKKREVALAKKRTPLNDLKKQAARIKLPGRTLLKSEKLQLIAEIKPKSPSAGIIRTNFNVVNLVKEFQANKASAISVLTDKKYFGGSLKNLPLAKKASSVPILRKEFIIDEYQLFESKVCGADLVLLIVSVLKNKLKHFVELSLQLKLQPLIEVHGKNEVMMVLKQIKVSPKIIIGVNNRNLKTFKTSLDVSLKLIKFIPKQFIRISESGIFETGQLRKLSKAGFDGVLIGAGLFKNPKLFNYFKS